VKSLRCLAVGAAGVSTNFNSHVTKNLFGTVWLPVVILILSFSHLVDLLPLLHDLVILIGRIVVVISLGPLIIVVGMLPVVVSWCISLILLIIIT